MESIIEKGVSFFTLQASFITYFRFFILLPFLVIITKWCWNRCRRNYLVNRLPTLKIRPFNFLGHVGPFINMYLFKYPAPLHVYHLNVMTGMAHTYGKDGILFGWILFRPIVLCFKAESVELLLSHSTEIKKAYFYRFMKPWLGEGLLTSDGSKWKQKRKLLTPAFHFNILKDFLPAMNKQSKILVNVLKHHTNKYTNITPIITKCSLDIICETILGVEMHSQTLKECEYLKSISIIEEIITDRVFQPWYWSDLILHLTVRGWKFRKHVHQVREFSRKLISKKKKEKLEAKSNKEIEAVNASERENIYFSQKKRALLDLLLDEHIKNDSISEEDIREEVDTFTFAGHDTISMALSWSFYLIGLHPDIQKKIQDELDSIFGDDDRDPTVDDLRDMKYLECVYKEALRLYPPVPGFGRQLQEDINFKGHLIPKGTACFMWTHQLHRDPEVFPNPEKFDPDRFKPENCLDRHPYAYLPFSAGLRNCIGQKFATMELKCVLSAVLRKYNIKSLQPRDQVHSSLEVTLRPFGGIKLEIKERK